MCERRQGHEGLHEAGDHVPWSGTVRRLETQNRVYGAWLNLDEPTPRDIAKKAHLHIDTVRRHLRALRAEGLLGEDPGASASHQSGPGLSLDAKADKMGSGVRSHTKTEVSRRCSGFFGRCSGVATHGPDGRAVACLEHAGSWPEAPDAV